MQRILPREIRSGNSSVAKPLEDRVAVRDVQHVESCSVTPFEERGRALPSADTHRDDAVPRLAARHLIRDRPDETRTCHAERVADRERTAVRIQLVHPNSELAVTATPLRRARPGP